MKRIILLFSMLGISAALIAQEISGEEREQLMRAQAEYFEQLALSDLQQQSYQRLILRYEKSRMAALQGLSESSAKRRIRQLEKQLDKDVRQVLDDRQYDLFKERRKKLRRQYE